MNPIFIILKKQFKDTFKNKSMRPFQVLCKRLKLI